MRLDTAANGRAWLTTDSGVRYAWCVLLLLLRHGFRPRGGFIPPVTDEAIFPTLDRRGLQLLAGWDNCSGYQLFADSTEADQFLRAFAARRGATVVAATDISVTPP